MVIAIIGVLAAIAAAEYSTYIARAQLAEVLNVLQGRQAYIIETLGATGHIPATLDTSGISSKYVESVEYRTELVSNGEPIVVRLQANLSDQVNYKIQGGSVALVGGPVGSIIVQTNPSRWIFQWDGDMLTDAQAWEWYCQGDLLKVTRAMLPNNCK